MVGWWSGVEDKTLKEDTTRWDIYVIAQKANQNKPLVRNIIIKFKWWQNPKKGSDKRISIQRLWDKSIEDIMILVKINVEEVLKDSRLRRTWYETGRSVKVTKR